MTAVRAFTLVELLVAIAIVALLLGMAMPLISVARRHGAIANTQTMLAKVLTALELFKDEVGAYPYQSPADSLDGAVRNRLAYHLAHRLDDAERAALGQDLATASSAFARSGSATLAMLDTDVAALEPNSLFRDSHASLANRLAATRARVAIMAGCSGLTGFKAPPPGTFDRSGTPVLPAPASLGWGDDYLASDIAARELRIDPGAASDQRDGTWQIIDRWGLPLIYVNPVIPGVVPAIYQEAPEPLSFGTRAFPRFPVDAYQLGARGRAETATRSTAMTATAVPGMRFKPELWSAGPDGLFDDMRDAGANRDNIPASAVYLKGLP
ncbi:MAG: type II secretion system protein [Planctomycetes bacterium]|nr:type II secretion system protein [Planctomycetota bacterium]